MMVVSATSTNGLFQKTGTSEQIERGKGLQGNSEWLELVPIPLVLLRSATGEAGGYFDAM